MVAKVVKYLLDYMLENECINQDEYDACLDRCSGHKSIEGTLDDLQSIIPRKNNTPYNETID